MSIQELGSIGELIAAIATVLTLVYLAIQVRQNTRALKASTFQSISSELGQNVQPILQTPDMATIWAKGLDAPDTLSADERLKHQAMYMAMFRRLESVFVQTELGSIDREFVAGAELSLLSLLSTQFAREWWESAKPICYKPFVTHVEHQLVAIQIPEEHPAVNTTKQ